MRRSVSELAQRARHEDNGASAVEFALVFPLLVVMVFGMVYFGLAYNAKVTLTHAAREGVRAEAITDTGVATAVAAAGSAAGLSNVSASAADGGCGGANPGVATVSVTVQGDVDIQIPLFWSGTITLTECATMRDGG